MEEEVFVDAEEEVTPRRSNRKRRSTAGSTITPVTVKKPKTKMTTRHSPKNGQDQGRSENTGHRPAKTAGAASSMGVPTGADQDAFWSKMGGMLGGLEMRMKMETDQVKEQLGVAVDTLGALGSREKIGWARRGGQPHS